MAWMLPTIAVTGMDFLVIEDDATAPIKLVPQTGCLTRNPNALDLVAPTGLQHFVNVEADADIVITRDESQRRIAGTVEPPRCDSDVVNFRAQPFRYFRQTVVGTRVGDQDHVGFFGGFHKARHEVRFALSDGVDANLVADFKLGIDIDADFAVHLAEGRLAKSVEKRCVGPMINHMRFVWVAFKLTLRIVADGNADDDRIGTVSKGLHKRLSFCNRHVLQHVARKSNVVVLI